MKLKTFFEKFDQFADAPDAVAKMRELVLELAVRGRLLSSCRPDSSASSNPSSPFAIPHDWQWIALNKAADCRAAAKVDSSSLNDSDWVLDLEDIDGGAGKVIATATFAERKSLSTKASFQKSDVLYGKLRPYLNKVVIADRPGFCTTEIIPLRPQKFVAAGYLRLFLRSPHFLRYAAAKNYGMKMPRLGTQDLESAAIALPPLAEQKRIVAKVDELMALCDRLEAQQQERETRHAALARASLARFADAPTPANLPFLFHPSYAIPPADLRKSILTLAVQGKLVPQDPNDGDARDVIDRAIKKRQQTIQSKNLRRKVLDESEQLISEDELPASWCVERFANLVDPENTISYGVLVPGSNVASGIPFVRVQDLSINSPAKLPNKTIAPEIEKPYARTRLRGGEILLCVVGATIGRLGVAPASWAGANIARAVARIAPIVEVNRDYLLLVLRSPLIQSYFATTTRTLAQPTLNVGAIEQTPIPLPPLAEQRRIVAKVEQLMALVDALETQLAASRATAANLLSALVAELTTGVERTNSSERKVIDLHSSPEFIRALLAAEIVDRLHEDNTFGQTKLQKVIHLAEYLCELPEIDSRPARFARGPHDHDLISQVEAKMAACEWFQAVPRDGGEGKRYVPLAETGKHRAWFEKQWPEKAPAIRRLIETMKPWKTERCERFSTLYAAWNDLILWSQPATDDAILGQVLEHWHSHKREIPREKWIETLGWMRDHGYVPTGFGRATEVAPQSELLFK